MSAPQTDLDRQKRRHRGPLVGIVILVVMVFVFFLYFIGDVASPEDSLLGDGPTTVVPETLPPVVAPMPVTPVPAN